MALKFNNSAVNQINWNGGTDNVKVLKYPNDSTIVWCHPYTISSVGSGSINLNMYINNTSEPSSSTSSVDIANSSATRYHLDNLHFAVTISSAYNTDTFTWSVNGSTIYGTTYTVSSLEAPLSFSYSVSTCVGDDFICSSNNRQSGSCTDCSSTGISGGTLCCSSGSKKTAFITCTTGDLA